MTNKKINKKFGFSEALVFLKVGKKVARKSWNAPNQYIVTIPANKELFQGYPVSVCLGIKNAQDKIQPGWVPSQEDLFAVDWYDVEEDIYNKENTDNSSTELSEYKLSVYEHINKVSKNIEKFVENMKKRALLHDASKLKDDEKGIMETTFGRLKYTTYGTREYDLLLHEVQAALKLHYLRNDHHPEHFENGVNDMDLFQLTEMLCDWKAAVEKHIDGDIMESLKINKKRFDLSDQLYSIFKNTIDRWES